MKRHESLVPLSRDHHFGLIMAQRLILGLATNPRADWPTDPAQQATRLVEFFKSDLRAHFDIEETHVFPASGRSMADGDRQVEALIADHDAMRAMIRSLEADPASGPCRWNGQCVWLAATASARRDSSIRSFRALRKYWLRGSCPGLIRRLMQSDLPSKRIRAAMNRRTNQPFPARAGMNR